MFFVPVLGFLPYGWFESVIVRMVLADLRFGLVLSESLCPLVGHIRVYFAIFGARMLIVDHCFLCNVCVLYIGVLDFSWFVLCTLYYMFCMLVYISRFCRDLLYYLVIWVLLFALLYLCS